MSNRPFNIFFIPKAFVAVLPYVWVTFAVLFATLAFSLLLATLIVKGRLSRHLVPKLLATGFVNIVRCTPSIVMLFIVFYGVPKVVQVLFDVNINNWSKLFFVVTALSFVYSATLSELMRASYLAVAKGQYEAAVSIGLSPFQGFYRIVLPQAFWVALPNLGNSLINLLKEGSLAYTIGLIDIMGQGELVIARNWGGYALETYIAITVIYWVLTFAIVKSFAVLEKRYARGK